MTEASAAPTGGRGEGFYRSFLLGYGVLFFAPHTVSGALFLLGTVASNPAVGTAVLLGLFAATTVAQVLKRARLEVEQGVYGFNGALVAFAVFSMQGEATQLHIFVLLAAAFTVPITVRLVDGAWCKQLGLPILSLPSLVVGFPLVRSLECPGQKAVGRYLALGGIPSAEKRRAAAGGYNGLTGSVFSNQ